MRMSRPSLALILVVIALVNLPLVHSVWTRASVERNGVEVQATVTDAKNLGTSTEPSWWLDYTLPQSFDPQRGTWSAEVDAATYEQAEQDGTVGVTAIEGRPESAIVQGEVRSPAGLVGTLGADLILLALLIMLWRFRRGGRREVVTVEALEDISAAASGGSWEDLGDGTVRVRGEVLGSDEHEVLLELDDRLVRVVLDGHASPIGDQQPAQVWARLAISPAPGTNPNSR